MSDLGKISVTHGGNWNTNTPYEINTMVRYNGATYMSLKDSTGQEPKEDSTYWGLIAKDGTTPIVDSELSDTSVSIINLKFFSLKTLVNLSSLFSCPASSIISDVEYIVGKRIQAPDIFLDCF